MLHLPYLLKVLIAAILPFMLGWIWYGRLFGERWRKAIGMTMTPEDCKNMPPEMKRKMQINMAVTVGGWLFAALVYGWIYNNLNYGSISPFGLAIAMWLAFSLPPVASDVLWGGRPRELLWINGAYQLAGLLIVAFVIGWL